MAMKRGHSHLFSLLVVSTLLLACSGFFLGKNLGRHFALDLNGRCKSPLGGQRTWYVAASASAMNETIEGGPRINVGVRNIMSLLTSRYGNEDPSAWSKTRNYIYHTSHRLTLAQVQEVLDFLDTILSLDKPLVKTIVQTSPRILRKNAKSYLQPTVDFLLELWGPDLFRTAISRNPNLLLSSGLGHDGSANGEIETYLKANLGMKKGGLEKLKRSGPFVFALSLEKMKSVLDFLQAILEKGTFSSSLIPGILLKVVKSNPNLLSLSVSTNFEPGVNFLMSRCGLNAADMASLIKSSGTAVLGLSVEANLQPTIDYLSSFVKNEEDLKKCILTHPQLLGLSLTNLRAKVAYFDAIDSQELTVVPNAPSLASRVAAKSPAVYSLSLKENIAPKVDFLARVWGTPVPTIVYDEKDEPVFTPVKPIYPDDGKKQASLGHLLQEYPSIMTLSLEGNIQPTINFYNRTGYTVLEDSWNLVRGKGSVGVIRGRYIATSLYNRLLPRWHYVLARGVKGQDGPVPHLPLHLLAGCTDQSFCDSFGFEIDEFASFKSDSIPRLKFSSQFDTWLKTGRPIDV
jgi:hypothetical protein